MRFKSPPPDRVGDLLINEQDPGLIDFWRGLKREAVHTVKQKTAVDYRMMRDVIDDWEHGGDWIVFAPVPMANPAPISNVLEQALTVGSAKQMQCHYERDNFPLSDVALHTRTKNDRSTQMALGWIFRDNPAHGDASQNVHDPRLLRGEEA